MLKYAFLISTLLLAFSCGQNADEKTAAAVLSANIALGKGNCQAAINILEGNGRVNDNAPYLKALASSYACRAGYSTVTFFTSDLALTVTPSPLGGTTKYSTSSASVTSTLQSDQKFKDLQKAIDILLYAGGIDSTTEPTSTERAKYFTAAEAADINSQLLYMVLVQLGRYMYYYGDSTTATGTKGSGTGSNTCFTSYQSAHVTVKNALTAAAGTCTNVTTYGATHTQLTGDTTALAATTRKTRLCQGVVLLNSAMALLPNVIASVFSNPADQTAANAALTASTAAKTALIAADATTAVVAGTLNQTTCEDITIVTLSNIESYFAGMFESVFQ